MTVGLGDISRIIAAPPPRRLLRSGLGIGKEVGISAPGRLLKQRSLFYIFSPSVLPPSPGWKGLTPPVHPGAAGNGGTERFPLVPHVK